MRRQGAWVAAVAVVAAALVVAGSAPVAAFGGAVAPQTGEVDPDGVVLRAEVAPNGTAAWTVEYRVRLDDENTTAAFEDLRRDVRANRTGFRSRFAGRMSRTVDAAENETGRAMALRNVSVVAEQRTLPQTYGVVAYRFEWGGFARVDGDRLVVGDAVAGIFLDEESRLVLAWPTAYEAASVTPGGYDDRDSAVSWAGPVDFGGDEPRVVLQPAGSGGDGLPVTLAVGAVAALALAAVVGYGYRRRERGGERAAATVDGADDDAGATADDAGGETDVEDPPAAPPEELLSPEERVLRFVRESGGRVKQQAVVAEFDWTAARTSQVVGSLRDDGRVETFRLGRENVLTLPDVGVEGDAGEDEDGGDDRDLDPAA